MDVAAIIAEEKRLLSSNKWRETYDYLKPYAEEATESDLMWRLIRAFYRAGKHLAADPRERQQIADRALQISQRALKMHEDNFQVQKWSGVLLSWASDLGGTKNKIEKSFIVKAHFEKALAIDGSDDVVKHLLGRWCYEVCAVGWMTRKLAKALFATPPESSYEEALQYFQEGEDRSPGFFPGNWLFLAKTHYQLGNKKEARQWLTKLLALKAENLEDVKCCEEGRQLMRKL